MGNETSQQDGNLQSSGSIPFHSVHDVNALPLGNKPEQKEAADIPTTSLDSAPSHETGITSKWRRELEEAIKDTPKSNIIQHISLLFRYKKRLAKGSSCCVLLCQHITTKKPYALKEMSKYSKYNPSLYLTERKILTTLKSHPNVVTYFDSYIDNKCLYIVSEYCGGGTLLDKIIKMNKFTENIAAKYITTMLQAVHFIHQHNIAHRDLKPNNVVFDKPGCEGILKLIDFGDAVIIEDEEEDSTFVGTLHYFTPEMIKHKRRKGSEIRKGDMYCIGVIAYVLLTGVFPFHSKDRRKIKQLILEGKVTWPNHVKLTENCKDFILRLLDQNVEQRLSTKQALSHKWLSDASHADLGNDLKACQKNFHHSNMLQRLLIDAIFAEMSADEKRLIVNELQKYKSKRKKDKVELADISAKPAPIAYTRTDSIISEQEFVEFMIANHVDENTAKSETPKLFKQVSSRSKKEDAAAPVNEVDVELLMQQLLEDNSLFADTITSEREADELEYSDEFTPQPADAEPKFDILGSLGAKSKSKPDSKPNPLQSPDKFTKTTSLHLIKGASHSHEKLKQRHGHIPRSQTMKVELTPQIQIINVDSKLQIEISRGLGLSSLEAMSEMDSMLSSGDMDDAIEFARSESVYKTEMQFEFKHPSITVEQFRRLLSKAPQALDIQSVIDDLDPKHTGIIDLVNVTNYTREVKLLNKDNDHSDLY